MAQFIEFNCINNAAVQPLGPNNRVLVNVDTIRTVTALWLLEQQQQILRD